MQPSTKDTGDVVSFGKGEDGQLGHGGAESAARPRAVAALRGHGVSSVACGAGAFAPVPLPCACDFARALL